MKEVWIIKQSGIEREDGELVDVAWAYGKGEAAIRERDLTPDWLTQHGYNSRNAAVRQMWRIPLRKYRPRPYGGAEVVSVPVPEPKLRYKIYKCYEIVIQDEEGNEVGESNYCYGSRADAEDMARHELKLAMMDAQNT